MLRRLLSVGIVMFVGVAMVACDAGELPTENQELDGLPPSLAAGGFDDKVTAGGEAVAGSVVFHLSAAASSNDSEAWGEIQYWRTANNGVDALSVHADVTCLHVTDNLERAAMAGPIKSVQEDPAGQADDATHVLVEFLEDGTGSGDQARFRFASSPTLSEDCGLSGSTPGVYTDGNVNIRAK